MKTYNATKAQLLQAQVPLQTNTYKPISHDQIIDLTLESIYQSGFTLASETYSMAVDGNIANGKYTISNVADKEMQIQIAWQNSYNKQLSLKYAIGVHVFICSNGCISGDMGAFKKKHRGDIQEFTPKYITEYIKTAGEVFSGIQNEREAMKQIELSKRAQAELLGRMYVEEDFIESTQMNIIKRELLNPTYDYGAANSMWELYQFTTFAMREIHPSSWMDSHIDAHKFFLNVSNINSKPIAPKPIIKQLNWVEELEKLEL